MALLPFLTLKYQFQYNSDGTLTSNKSNGFSFFPSFQCCFFFERVKIQRRSTCKNSNLYYHYSELHSLKCRGLQSSKKHKTTHCCSNANICPGIIELVVLMQVFSIQQQCTVTIPVKVQKDKKIVTQ